MTKTLAMTVSFLAAQAIIAAGCGDVTDSLNNLLSCDGNDTRGCLCSNGMEGVQLCSDDGAWDVCVCPDLGSCDDDGGVGGYNCHPDNPCVNGTCKIVGPGQITCACNPGWDGTFCEVCAPAFKHVGNDCVAGCNVPGGECVNGTCTDNSCDCDGNWQGDRCTVCAGKACGDSCCIGTDVCTEDGCCTPRTCDDFDCGSGMADGCGGVIEEDCGTCAADAGVCWRPDGICADDVCDVPRMSLYGCCDNTQESAVLRWCGGDPLTPELAVCSITTDNSCGWSASNDWFDCYNVQDHHPSDIIRECPAQVTEDPEPDGGANCAYVNEFDLAPGGCAELREGWIGCCCGNRAMGCYGGFYNVLCASGVCGWTNDSGGYFYCDNDEAGGPPSGECSDYY